MIYLWKTVWKIIIKINMYFPHDPEITLLILFSGKIKIFVDTESVPKYL